MKIGSVAWGWTRNPEETPSGDSLERIADNVRELGFDIIDYLSTWESLDVFYTDSACKRIANHASSIGLEIGGFVYQSNLWNNPDPKTKEKQLEYFEKCAHAAELLGASTVSCIIPRPYGACPNPKDFPAAKAAYNLPADYCWLEDWERFTDMLNKACGIAARHDLKVAMECFPGTLCSTPHAMLQMLEDVGQENLGIQLDTAHLANQRIDIETAVFMLGGERIFNVHAKDTDASSRLNLPPGSGIVDYTAVITALNNAGYHGNISIEVELTDNPGRYMKQALEHLRLCMEKRY